MPTRDDQPATVPPPEGEDDAYSATTKVGAMPAQIMEKLRAEGLLPDEVEEEEKAKAAARDARLAAPRPAISLEKKKTSVAPPPSSGQPVPQLFSSPPSEVPVSKMETAKPPPPPEPVAEPSGGASDSIETPVAFALPPAAQLPQIAEPAAASTAAPAVVSEERGEATPVTTQEKPQKGPSKVVMAIVAVLVVVFLVVALMRLRG